MVTRNISQERAYEGRSKDHSKKTNNELQVEEATICLLVTYLYFLPLDSTCVDSWNKSKPLFPCRN